MPLFTRLRRPAAADKALIGLALLNAGITARLRVFPTSVRIVFEGGDVEAVARVLNDHGYRNASGQPFTRHAFQDLREVHVRGAVH